MSQGPVSQGTEPVPRVAPESARRLYGLAVPGISLPLEKKALADVANTGYKGRHRIP